MDAYIALAIVAAAGIAVFFGLPWVSALERHIARRRAEQTPAE